MADGARLRTIVDGDCFDSAIELEGIAIGSVTIEARFNAGAWAEIATGAEGAWTGTLSGQASGSGTLEIRVNGVVQDSRANISVGTTFVTQSTQLLFNPTAPHTWAGRPFVIDRGDGVWIVLYRTGLAHGDDSTAKVHIRFVADEGATWSNEDKTLADVAVTGFPLVRHNSDSTDNLGMAILVVCPNGDLLALCNERPKGIYKHRSTDGGETWSDEGKLDNPTEADETLIVGDNAWIVGSDIYLPCRYEATPNVHPHRVRLYKSTDNLATVTKVGGDVDTEDINEPVFFAVPATTKGVCVVRGEPNDATARIYTTTDYTAGTPTWVRNTAIGSLLKSLHYPVTYNSSHGIVIVGREYEAEAERGVIYLWDSTNNRPIKKSYFGSTEIDGYYCSVIEKANNDLVILTYKGTTLNASIYEYIVRLQ